MSSPSIFTRHLLKALAALATLVLCHAGASAQTPLEQLVSPGKLSEAHAKLESTCSSCHSAFKKNEQSGLCLDCHKPVAADFSKKTGFHGRSPKTAGVECKTCHAEHEGRGADIMGLDRASFNHNQTDFALKGKHALVGCSNCHTAGKKFAQAPTDCASCHAQKDPHQGKLGRDCASCHTPVAWTEVTFEHSKTKFPLVGEHQSATCTSCHKNQVWKGLKATCVDCHAEDDAHKGRFGKDCASCHAPDGWKTTKFDHSRTGFSLTGAHAKTECASCHKVSLTAPVPKTCIGCHAEDDSHKGRNGTNCASCHSATSASWTTVTFNHNTTKFPLLGKHKVAKCETCHTQPVDKFKPPTACADCHTKDDYHKGLLGPKCKDCHAETAWTNIRFDHAKDARFALRGKHATAKCETCHLEPVKVKSPPATCIGCHQEDDPHKGQLGGGCATCHSEADWKTNVKFDHDFTSFPLLGKHSAALCVDCHKTPAFLDASADCASCHKKDDKHKGRFGADCAQCHNPSAWARASFNHQTQTRFPLTGEHASVGCESCHKSPMREGVDMSMRCVSCHASDDKHRGSFGATCERCHTTEGFADVKLNR